MARAARRIRHPLVNGRTRHLLIDQDGLFVTPADVQDRDAARILLTRLHAERPEVVLAWADNGYGGEEFSTRAQDTLGITIKVVPPPPRTPRARDHERLMSHAESHIQCAFITLRRQTAGLVRPPRRLPE